MILQIVRFRSGLPDDKVRENYRERSSRYREVKGLLQKYYLRYPETGEHGAVYVWASEEALKDFRASDLGRSIADTYKIEGEKAVENAEVLLTLRP